MKQCRKNCAPFREYWPRGYPGEVQGLKWTHCPYCDSGKLVDKEAELKDEFLADTIKWWNSSEYNSEVVKRIFSKYNITKKE